MYLSFAVFSYNLSINSSTGFRPFFQTFGSEERLPPDIVFGYPAPAVENVSLRSNLGYTVHSTFKVCPILSHAIASVTENLHLFNQRDKDRYDLGSIKRVF